MAVRDDRSDVKQTTTGFRGPLMVQSLTSAKSKFLSLDKEIQNGSKFKDIGMQIAAGVPLQCDEGDDYQTFRLGLFGLDKLKDVDAVVKKLEQTINQII